MRTLLAAAFFLTTVGWAPRVLASPTAELHFTRDAGTDTCPDAAAMHRAVAAQLGYDPFVEHASIVVVASIAHQGKRLVGHVDVSRPGEPRGAREVTAGDGDCAHLAEAMALTISIAIDPMVISRPPPAPVAPPPASPPPSSSPPPDPSPPVAAREPTAPPAAGASASLPSPPSSTSRVSIRGGLTALATVGVAPAVAFGLDASASLRWPRFSIGVEGRADLPSSAPFSTGGELSTSLLAGLVVPCVHAGVLAACALGAVGSLRGEASGISNPRSDYGLVALAGARVALEIPLSRVFIFRPQIDGAAAIARPALQLNDAVVWTLPLLSGSLGLGILGRF